MEGSDRFDWRLSLLELIQQGQGAAAKLHASLFPTHGDGDGSPASAHEDLAGMVVGSFSKALSLLGYRDSAKPDGTASCCLSSTGAAPPGPEPVSGGKIDGRGRYKRRKYCDSWSETAPALVDDGRAWRKYGQKLIHGSDFPRSYFRCTHKLDQKCEAGKQVQQISRNPPSYRTTYFGHHTCNNASVPSPFILDVANPNEGMAFNMVSFDGTASGNMEDYPFSSNSR